VIARRRVLQWSLGWPASATAVAASAQVAAVPRIGVIYPGPATEPGAPLAAFRQGLREQGYVENASILVDVRFDGRSPEVLVAQAQELLRLGCDLLVAGHVGSTRAASSLTKTVPIVMAVSGDPVADGLVASLARPGGNVTGLSIMSPELIGRRMQLLAEIVPGLVRVGLLLDTAARWKAELAEAERAAAALRLALTPLPVAHATEFDAAFAAARQARLQALVLGQSPLIAYGRERLAELALAARLPAISGSGDGHFARSGGLMNFGASLVASWHRAAHYVRRILQGAKPAELPIEQPRKFELVINRKTAARLGVTVPPHLMVLADEVI
jgi:putative ABC transport system substrate-binding protein